MKIDFTQHQKIIVGEGPSDAYFLSKFCTKNNLGTFGFADPTQIPNGPGGWEQFGTVLGVLPSLPKFENLTDIALFCDSGDKPERRFVELKNKVEAVVASGPLGAINYRLSDPAIISIDGMPRVHVFMVPKSDRAGGIESLCLEAAAEAFDGAANPIMQAVDEFAAKVCILNNGNPWTVEKTDKLRLQAFISAASPRKPDVHFYRLFDAGGDKLVPLDGKAFDEIKNFLSAIAAL